MSIRNVPNAAISKCFAESARSAGSSLFNYIEEERLCQLVLNTGSPIGVWDSIFNSGEATEALLSKTHFAPGAPFFPMNCGLLEQ